MCYPLSTTLCSLLSVIANFIQFVIRYQRRRINPKSQFLMDKSGAGIITSHEARQIRTQHVYAALKNVCFQEVCIVILCERSNLLMEARIPVISSDLNPIPWKIHEFCCVSLTKAHTWWCVYRRDPSVATTEGTHQTRPVEFGGWSFQIPKWPSLVGGRVWWVESCFEHQKYLI